MRLYVLGAELLMLHARWLGALQEMLTNKTTGAGS
jgi:hypothetical protein